MVPPHFKYVAPSSLAEVVSLLQAEEQTHLLAGGQDLLVRLKLRRLTPRLLVDLQHIASLRRLARPQGELALHLGAMVTCRELAAQPEVRTHGTALAEAAQRVGDPQVRNRSTLGGSLAAGNPASDLAAALLALGVVVHVVGPYRRRTVQIDEFFTGPFDTALESTEVIEKVTLPEAEDFQGSAYEKIGNPASGLPICGVAASLSLTAHRLVHSARVAVTGVAASPVRLTEVEGELQDSEPSAGKLRATAEHATAGLRCVTDLFASGDYRASLVTTLTERALTRARDRAVALPQ